jgi:hypothetical protein
LYKVKGRLQESSSCALESFMTLIYLIFVMSERHM